MNIFYTFFFLGLTKGEMVLASCLPSDEASIKEFRVIFFVINVTLTAVRISNFSFNYSPIYIKKKIFTHFSFCQLSILEYFIVFITITSLFE